MRFDAKQRVKIEGDNFRHGAATRQPADGHDHNKEVTLEFFEEMLKPSFGEYEAMRIAQFFRDNDFETISF